MALRENSYAKIWSAKPSTNGKTYSCQLSVSRKNKDTGKYEPQFTGYVTFAGSAATKVAGLGLPERVDKNNSVSRSIQIKSSPDVSSFYDNEKTQRLLNLANGNEELIHFIRNRSNEKYVTIWDFDLADSSTPAPAQKSPTAAPMPDDDDDNGGLPF